MLLQTIKSNFYEQFFIFSLLSFCQQEIQSQWKIYSKESYGSQLRFWREIKLMLNLKHMLKIH